MTIRLTARDRLTALGVGMALAAGARLPVAAAPPAHRGAVLALALSAEGDKAVSGGQDGVMIRWPLEDAAGILPFRFHSAAITAIAYLPDDWVVTGGADGKVALWKPGEAEPMASLSGNTAPINALGISEAIGGIAVGSADGLRVWIGSGIINDTALAFPGHPGHVTGIAFSTDQVDLISSGTEGTLRITSITGGDARAVTVGVPLHGLAIAFDGEMVAAADDGRIHLRLRDGAAKGTIPLSDAPLRRLALSFDGDLIAAIDQPGRLWLAERRQARAIGAVRNSGAPLTAVAFHPDGKRVFAGDAEGRLSVWNAIDGAPLGQIPVTVRR